LSAFADSSGCNPVSIVFFVQGSARSVAQKVPGGISLISLTNVSETVTFSPFFRYISHPGGEHSCPTFSFTVILDNRSATRSSVEACEFL
jgi:hypothetical protein